MEQNQQENLREKHITNIGETHHIKEALIA